MTNKLIDGKFYLMGKKLLGFIFGILLVFASVSSIFGAPTETIKIIPPYPRDEGLNFLGQNHAYSVTFRGNGEAVVLFKAIFSNPEEQSLTALDFRFPGADPKDIAIFQVIREGQCLKYKSGVSEQQKCLGAPLGSGIKCLAPDFASICEEYQEPNYFQYGYGQAKYQKAKYTLEGDTLRVVLPNVVKANASGSIIISYRGFGYAKKSLLGAYNFVFETLKINDKIQNLQVGIDTDSDLYLRGAKGKVNYRFEEGISSLKMAPTAEMGAVSPQMDNLYQQIGYGAINKTASNLQSLDSYTVKGSYADSRLKLYAKEAIMIMAVIFILLLIFGLLVKFIFSKIKAGAVGPTTNNFVLVFGLSFGTSFIFLLFTLFLIVFNALMNNLINSLFLYEMRGIIYLLIIILSLTVYAVLITVPVLYVGVKKGASWGLATLALTIFWLFFYLVTTVLALFFFGSASLPPSIEVMKSTIQSVAE